MNLETQSTKPLAMDQVSALRILADNNQVFNAMAHVFAMRERTRGQITVSSLFASMEKEGYKYTKEEYAKVLSSLADIKLGRLEKNGAGKSVALKDIRYTLQSIGMASIAKKPDLTKYQPKKTYIKLPAVVPAPVPSAAPTPASPQKNPAEKKGMDKRVTRLEVRIGYKTFIYDNFPADRIQDVISQIDNIHEKT